MTDDPEERSWYLLDEPLEHLDEEDKLRHKGYVRILLNTIKEMSPPFTLGIFGGWGVGKTSIVRDFRNSAKQDQVLAQSPIVLLDIWKYEGDSLRRQFLIDMQDGLKNQGALDKHFFVEPQLYTSRTEEGQTESRFSLRRLKEAIPLLLEVFLIVAAGMYLISWIPIDGRLQLLMSSLLIPLLLYIIPRLSRVVVVQKKYSISEAALYSSEQFEKAFKDMISDTNCKCKKIVIVIDNLDRCCRSRVVEVLSVIKTYLEPIGENKCIFVIPCDDLAIKEQIKSEYKASFESSGNAEEYADEYIRKFFNASIRITPFIEKEIEPYIETQLGKMLLTKDMDVREIKQLTQMISSVFRKNPRQIKQFLNNLSSKYLLVKEREAEPEPMIKPKISDNIMFLAKVTVIETKFSVWYRKFETDDNLYGEVARSLYTPDSKIKKGDDLWHFLDLTRDINPQNYKAFFHLKQNPHEAKIPNYDQFSEAIRTRDREKVLEVFESSTDEAKNAQLEEIILQISNNVRKGYYEFTVHAISVGCAIVPKLKTDDKKDLAREIISTIAKHEEVRNNLNSLMPSEVFALMPDADKTDSNKVRGEYVELYSKELPEGTVGDFDLPVEIAKAIVNDLDSFSRPQLKEVRTITAGFKTVSPDLLLTISSSKEAIQAFVESSLVAKVIDEIAEEDVTSFVQTDQAASEHEPHIEFIIRCPDYVGGDIATKWIQKLASLLEPNINKNPQLEDYIQRCIDDSYKFCEKADSSAVDQLAHLTNQRYPQVDAEHRMAIILSLQDIYNRCSAQQDVIKNRVISDFVPSEPLDNVIRFIAIHSENEFEDLPYIDNVFDHLAIRVVSEDNPENRRLLSDAFDGIGTQVKLNVLARLLTTIIRRPEIAVTVSIVQELISNIPKHNIGKNLVRPILDETIHPSRGSIPVQEQRSLFKLAIKMKEWHTNDFRDEFEGIITELLCSDNPSNRQLSLEILGEAYQESVISENSYIAILHMMKISLIERKPAPDESIMQQLGLIININRHIKVKVVPEFIGYLRQLIQPQVDINYRQKSLSYLSTFIDVPLDILQEVIPELVGYAERENNQNVRIAIEECLLSLREHNRPLDRDLWEDLYRYIRGILASPDDTQKERGKELRKRMSQITIEAKKAAGIAEPTDNGEPES